MPYPTKEQWIEQALTGDAVWQIGQIDADTAKALNKLVKQGRLLKCRGSFCGISNWKTIWCRPGLAFSFIEAVECVEAHGEALAEQTRLRAEFETQFSQAA